MRIVIDTNVIVSRVINPDGPPSQLIRKWEEGAFLVLVSHTILEEYREVLRYERLRKLHKWTDEEIDDFVARFARFAEIVTTDGSLHVVKADPDDDKFLECALSGGAEYLVTGDAHLLSLGSHQDIYILSPSQFLAFLLDSP